MLKSNSGKQMQNKALTDSATNRPKPGDFPLGSLQSRAAARMALRQNTVTVINLDANGQEIRRRVSPTPADESLTIYITLVG
jgi:hypothetical protein